MKTENLNNLSNRELIQKINERYNLNIPSDDYDIQDLVNYVRSIAFNDGYLYAKECYKPKTPWRDTLP